MNPIFGIGRSVLGTTGGNDLMISASQNLHHYWDANAVTGAAHLAGLKGKVDPAAFAEAIVNNPPTGWQTAGLPDTWAVQWANESLALAAEALTRPEFDEASEKSSDKEDTCTASVSIDQEYKTWANQVALDQLGKAGFRLSALLVWIFEGH
jgi:hypothetical protein